MIFTIEPMINEGVWQVEVLADNLTAVTKDRKLSASVSILSESPRAGLKF